MNPIPHLYTVIMAGGSGTRFWPLSRHLFPKQLLKIIGEETMIQQTMRRVLRCTPPDRVLISTTPAQADSIRVQLAEWKDALKDNYLLEPEARNTAPAIALAATEAIHRDPDAVMLLVPADHVIHKDERFDAAVRLGAELAAKGYLVTFGVPPSRPETGYGYIQPNRQRKLAGQGGLAGYAVKRFVEGWSLLLEQRHFRLARGHRAGGDCASSARFGEGNEGHRFAGACADGPGGSRAHLSRIDADFDRSWSDGAVVQSCHDPGRLPMVRRRELEQPGGGVAAGQGRERRQRQRDRSRQPQFDSLCRSAGGSDDRA
jgi:hypothetical protein